MRRVAILLGFQIAWFATAFAVMGKRPGLGTAMSLAICAAHLIARDRRARLAALVVVSGALGFVADSMLVTAGVLRFDVDGAPAGFSPLWMVLLWSNLALTVDALPAWVSARLPLTAAAGAMAGPLSYLAGERFDALHFLTPRAWSITAVAIEWTLAMPMLVVLERRLRARADVERVAL